MTGTNAPVTRLLEQAMALMGRGEHAQALALCDEALRLAPDSAPAFLTASVALHRLRRGADALRAATTACRLRPDWAEAWTNTGHHHFAQGDYASAAQAFARAGDLAPDQPGPCVSAGQAWERVQAWSRAAAAYRSAYNRAPANTAIWEACDRMLELTGQPDAAARLFADHVRRVPLSARLAAAGLVYARMLADPVLEARCFDAVVARDWERTALPALVHALGTLQYYDIQRERLLALYRRANALRQENRRGDAFRVKRRLARGQTMRVGYLSADFRTHPMGMLVADILRHHDPAVVEPHLFSLALPGNEDALTAECRRLAASYEVLTPLDDRAAADRIAARELDLLVDLMSLTGFARSGILLHKPAPVIVTHLGHHGPVGLEQVDYKITDAFADPPANAAFQIEGLLPLATCVLPFRRVVPAPEPPTRSALGLPRDAIVCAQFVGPNKLSPRCLGLWARFLDRVPAACLLFSPAPPFAAEPIAARLAAFGIPRERIAFVPFEPDEARGRARYAVADLVLDTFPYTGGEATVAALDMGVPVVTVVGARQAERMTASILHHLGVPELIAADDVAFVELASRLATDAPARAALRRRILGALDRKALGDMAHYVRCLEAAYRTALAAHGMSEPVDAAMPAAPT